MSERKKQRGGGSPVVRIFGAGLLGCAASVALALAFSFVLMKQWMGVNAMPYINAGIKAACAAVSAIAAVRHAPKAALLRGAAAGIVYMFVTTAVFSLLSGGFSLGLGLLTDLAVCSAVGAAVGVIHNLRS